MITLTGFMGSGKTTVGKAVADMLGCNFYDLDELVVRKAHKSIPRIFAEDGEAAFRALEAACLQEAVRKWAENDVVLSLGGGSLGNAESLRLVREKTVCIYLRATLDTLMERVSGDAGDAPAGAAAARPMLAGDVPALLESRIPAYEAAASIVLDTDGCTPEDIATEIIMDCL